MTFLYNHVAPFLSYHLRWGLVGVYVFILSGVVFTLRKSSPGQERAIVAVIAFIPNLILPTLFHHDLEIVSQGISIFLLTWLANFKVIGWCIGRGPLTMSLTFPQLVVAMGMPVTPVLDPITAHKKGNTNARQTEVGETAAEAAINFLLKVCGLVLVVTLLQGSDYPKMLQHLMHLFGAYCFLGVIQQFVGFWTVLLLGMQVAPHFDRPFLSSSLADFWSRRWNLNTGYVLRFLIYDPIVEGRLISAPHQELLKHSSSASISRPSRPRRFLATCAAFFVSGVMHEVFIVYVRGRISWYWLVFFTLQGPLVCAESVLRGWALARGLEVPRPVAVVATISLLLVLADWYFFYDILRMGLPQHFIANLHAVLHDRGARVTRDDL